MDGARKSSHAKSQKHQRLLEEQEELLLSQIIPSSSTEGTFVTLKGIGFTGLCQIFWEKKPIKTYFCYEDGTLHCFIPVGPRNTTATVVVNTPNRISNSLLFNYL